MTLKQFLAERPSVEEIREFLDTTSSKSRPLHIQITKVKGGVLSHSTIYDSPVEDVERLTNGREGYRITRGFNILNSDNFD